MPATIATGAARMSGQGVATTSTARARTGLPEPAHAMPATESVSSKKNIAKRSARRTKGAFEACASRTRRMIPAYVLSSAVVRARMSNGAPALITPLRTRSLRSRSTGIASPVSADSSSTAKAESITPSTGTISPDLTRSRSPTWTSAISGDASSPCS